ncbi:hypothetical protein BDV23DRAFT_34209 [Aspergillus alliaceus]|uniref:Uncharacterized protein n=1 Tax=Petromyces alliaceus TaxID=209559 RepID=A0A5N7CJP3_PETAA|nr:hypothetical protein BDV23DRAFT_34209 [Aspergillus alliaceus]
MGQGSARVPFHLSFCCFHTPKAFIDIVGLATWFRHAVFISCLSFAVFLFAHYFTSIPNARVARSAIILYIYICIAPKHVLFLTDSILFPAFHLS